MTELRNLCVKILKEFFGDVPSQIGSELSWGPKTLPLIKSALKLPLAKVKEGLVVLISNGVAKFEAIKEGLAVQYILLPERVLTLSRIPRYLATIENKLGYESKLLIEEVVKHGTISISQMIIKVAARCQAENPEEEVKVSKLYDDAVKLVFKEYLIRMPAVEDCSGNVPIFANTEENFKLPELNAKNIRAVVKGESSAKLPDHNVVWRLNHRRFDQDLRDEVMISAITKRFDAYAGKLMEILLKLMYERTSPWQSVSNPIPITLIKDTLVKARVKNYLYANIQQYLKVMENDSSRFLSTSIEGPNNITVNVKHAVESITHTLLDHIVAHRFGDKPRRIFRIIRSKKYCEQEQIQKIAMVPDKEAKKYTYKLLEENFIQLTQLSRPAATSGPGINKVFYLFHVNLDAVVQMVIHQCYQALGNAMSRRDHERSENARLIEKKNRIDSFAKSLKEQGQSENEIKEMLEDLMTPPEKTLLENVNSVFEKLSLAEEQLDDTLFILQLFQHFQRDAIKNES
ncbi:unnamed protein product [Bemisia tabaci]|uniref:DNA-directed RNA polymerase III subunit RPC3 n=1 Tax=Bemisia tabaci TaxID=7038 RepID=A0A9P0A7K6_BEMTA|nr:unnamed protein product [Bemisia tabaci]